MSVAHETTTMLCFLELHAAFGDINEETPIHEPEQEHDIHSCMVRGEDDSVSCYLNVGKYWVDLSKQRQQDLVVYFWKYRSRDASIWTGMMRWEEAND